MKKLPIFLISAILASAFVLAACQSQIWSGNDTEVAFDGSGHVTQDVTYDLGSYIETFSADGTYEDVSNSWDSASSSWLQSAGDKGTYSYDKSSRILMINYAQTWIGGIGGSYVTLTTSSGLLAETRTFSYVLGSANKYGVLSGSGGVYGAITSISYWDGTSRTSTSTCTIASDLSTLTLTSESETYDAGGTVTAGSRSSNVYTVSAIFPGGVTSMDQAKGKAVTYNYLKYVNTPYTWTSGSNFTAGAPTTQNSSGSRTYSVAGDGSYIASVNYRVARNLARAGN